MLMRCASAPLCPILWAKISDLISPWGHCGEESPAEIMLRLHQSLCCIATDVAGISAEPQTSLSRIFEPSQSPGVYDTPPDGIPWCHLLLEIIARIKIVPQINL